MNEAMIMPIGRDFMGFEAVKFWIFFTFEKAANTINHMKIGLFHNSTLPPKTYGGVERILLALAREYTRLGHTVVIIGREGSTISDYEFVGVPANFLTDKINQILPSGLDFLHSNEPLLQQPKIPFLVTIHGNGQSHETYWPNTNFLSASHAHNHNGKFFVFNGLDPDQYPFQLQKDSYFVFLARTTWRVKNVRTAIAWANDLGVRLEIMGGQGISRGNIHYNGLIDEAQKINLLKNARALIYPTNWDEPCAAAPLEALACGTPVIASANGCMPELVRAGTGIICKSYDELLSAGHEVKNIDPKKCRAAVEEFFSLKRMAQDYLKLINKILVEGQLQHQPHYNFKSDSVNLLYKPTFLNRTKLALTGKI